MARNFRNLSRHAINNRFSNRDNRGRGPGSSISERARRALPRNDDANQQKVGQKGSYFNRRKDLPEIDLTEQSLAGYRIEDALQEMGALYEFRGDGKLAFVSFGEDRDVVLLDVKDEDFVDTQYDNLWDALSSQARIFGLPNSSNTLSLNGQLYADDVGTVGGRPVTLYRSLQ